MEGIVASRRLLAGVSLVVSMAVLGLGSGPADAQRAVREQHVRVAVADRNHAPVSGLTARDLTVREDGVAREVLAVAPAATPLTVAIVADDSEAAQPIAAELRAGLRVLSQELLGGPAGSEVALMTVGERPTRVADFTALSTVVDKAIDRVFPRAGAGAHVLDGILEMSRALVRKEVPRRTIVAIFADSGPEFSAATRAQIEAALRAGHISLWTIVVQSSSLGLSPERRARAEVTVEVAEASGGLSRTVLAPQGVESACRSVGALLRAEYDVTYARPESLVPPKARQISTSRDGAKVVASRWITP